MNDWESISFILAGKKRRGVLEILHKGPYTPTQIAYKMKIKISNVSVTLKELLERGFIQNMTPGIRKGKILKIT